MPRPPTPTVSILLPVRDAGAYLESCLRSIERQTLRDFEVIAVDDGSRDDSGETLRGRARSDRLRRSGSQSSGYSTATGGALAPVVQ